MASSCTDGKLPISRVGIFSYISISWLSSLVWRMYRRRDEPVSEDDIWEISDEDDLDVNGTKLKKLWNDELTTKGAEDSSFSKVWWRFVWRRVMVTIPIITIMGLATFFSAAYLLQMLVQYLETKSSDLARGIGLVIGVSVCEIVRTLSFSSLMVFSSQTGMRFVSGFMAITYDKLLRLRVMKGKTNSEILNIFSVDSYRVYMMTQQFVFFLAMPIYLIIGTVYAFWLVGPWAFIALGTFLICYQIQAWLTNTIATLRQKRAGFTDARVRRMGEVINSIKFIKMYAWEYPFFDAINQDRRHEQKYLLYAAIVNISASAIIPITPTVSTILTIVAYTGAGNTLSASTVVAEGFVGKENGVSGENHRSSTITCSEFYVLWWTVVAVVTTDLAFALVGTMNFVKLIVTMVPMALKMYQEAKISFQRIKMLLLMEEYQKPSTNCIEKRNAVEIHAGTFLWDLGESDIDLTEYKNGKKHGINGKVSSQNRRGNSSLIGLYNIQIDIPKGRLVGICGSVGSGKSSLIAAIMGRMPMLAGRLAVKGTVAYVAQQAWIINDTLKDNILFGRQYNLKRYLDTIKACALETDLELLADGDDTEIGERGVNLSGGQKQRVNLARAVYSDSDIYILDDPLSAVDVRVGKLLFHDCIKRMLAGKTVILVTHQLQYLEHCDEVVVMQEGSIIEKGTHLDLLAKNGTYANMLHVFNLTSMKTTHTDAGKETDEKEMQDTTTVLQPSAPVPPFTANYGAIVPNGVNGTTKKKKGRLITQEGMGIGSVSLDTYRSYINSAGGVCVAVSVVLLYIVASASVIFADWWLSQWINSINQDVGTTFLFDQTANHTERNHSETSFNPAQFASWSVTIINNSTAAMTDTLLIEASRQGAGGSVFGIISYTTFIYVYVGALIGMILLQILKAILSAKTYIKASSGIHKRCLENVLKAKMAFFDATPAGRILNRFSKDMDQGDVFIPDLNNAFLQILVTSVLSITLTAVITPWILIAVVPLVIIVGVLKNVSTVSIRQLKRLENVVRSPLLSHVNVTATGLSTITCYNQKDRFSKMCEKLGGVAATSLLLFHVSMRWIGLRLDIAASSLTVTAALILVLSQGSITPANAGLILNLTLQTGGLMQWLIRIMNEAEANYTSIERLNEYATNIPTEPQHAAVMADPGWPAEGNVEFCDVVMKYRPGMETVLKHVSFAIVAKQKIGIVGRTGAGKSSLAACLFRLVELTSGRIMVDNMDISQIHLKAIRSNISTIPQDPVLFSGTMRYNIDPFDSYTDSEIWAALGKVNMKKKVDDAVDGLNLVVEDNGENFSVGERQLICLARAVLRNSKILLLDEATANIDTSTDAMIQHTIRTCFKDCTVITIAHRLNTVLHSDQIIVMDAGQVVECDAPAVLLSEPDSFLNRMIAAQFVKTEKAESSDL